VSRDPQHGERTREQPLDTLGGDVAWIAGPAAPSDHAGIR